MDDGQDRGEAGKVGDNRKSRTSAEKGGRETRGVRDSVLGTGMTRSALRTRTHGHGGKETREVKTSVPDVCAPPRAECAHVIKQAAQAVDRPRQAKREPSQARVSQQ